MPSRIWKGFAEDPSAGSVGTCGRGLTVHVLSVFSWRLELQ